jgi:hypothetical protein
MATALEGVANLTVLSLRRGFNQAAILTAEHAVKVDSTAAIPIGTEVTYTDDDLGFVFRGVIASVTEAWQGGEGIVYVCADIYRWLMKEPATIGGTSKIQVEETDPRELIDTLLTERLGPSASSSVMRWDVAAVPDSFNLEPLNMAGQSIGEWIQRALDQTEETVCWVEYVWDVPLARHIPLLKFDLLSNLPDVDLQKGTYSVIDPAEGDTPLIVGGTHNQSLDNKYHEVCIEGCGDFERFNLRFIQPEDIDYDDVQHVYTFKYFIPEDWATARFLDADGNCREDWWVRLVLGNATVGLTSIDQHSLEALWDETAERYYWEVQINVYGVFTGPPPTPQVSAYFTYTGYKGPLVACVTASSIAETEGKLVVQRPDLFKFTGDSNHDDTTLMDAIADRYYDRYCAAPDRTTDFALHLKGFDTDLVLGATIVTPDLGSPRVQEIGYDFRARNINTRCSDKPLRAEVENAESRARLATELGNNWYLSSEREDSCMCGGQIFNDPSEKKTNFMLRPGGGGGDKRESWDCVNAVCVKRNNDKGQFATLVDCEQQCFPFGWDFVPCVGCYAVTQGWGQYMTKEDCETANPDPFAPAYNCGSGESGAASAPVPVSDYRDYECDGVSCAGGGGSFFIGFIRKIRVTKQGTVVVAECADYEFEEVSGFTGWVSFMVSADIVSGSIHVEYYNRGRFEDGLLIEMETIAPAPAYWTSQDPTGRCLVAKSCCQ